MSEDPKCLANYVSHISSDPGEYRVVSREVNPREFEATAILEHLDRQSRYPAVMFANPLDIHGGQSEFPLLMNLWATRERCADALGLDRGEAGARLGTHFAEMKSRPIEPVLVDADEAPAQAHVLKGDEADMWRLPGVTHSELDLGPVLTMGMAMKAPGEDFYNITFVKLFPEDGRRGGVTIHSRDMSRMLRLWQDRQEPARVVYILGHHPAFWLGTVNNTPYGDNEYATAGGYLGEAVRLAPSVTWGHDFLVPADAEILIEGHILPGERTIVDPFGEISRQYQPQELAPVFEASAMTYRAEAIMQDVFSGHREHMLLGSIGREGTIYAHLQQVLGNVTAVHLPYSGVGRHVAYVSMKKVSEAQPKQAALATIAHVPNLQIVVVVDDDIDVFKEEDVVWAVGTYVQPDRDIDLIKNLQPPTDPKGIGASRILIDATRPTHIPFPTRLRIPHDAMRRVVLDEWLDPANTPQPER